MTAARRPGCHCVFRLRCWRRMVRRSSSVLAPHTPASWFVSSAHSRHASTTGQPAHTAFAWLACSSAAPAVPCGKKNSTSMSRHAALSRQLTAPPPATARTAAPARTIRASTPPSISPVGRRGTPTARPHAGTPLGARLVGAAPHGRGPLNEGSRARPRRRCRRPARPAQDPPSPPPYRRRPLTGRRRRELDGPLFVASRAGHPLLWDRRYPPVGEPDRHVVAGRNAQPLLLTDERRAGHLLAAAPLTRPTTLLRLTRVHSGEHPAGPCWREEPPGPLRFGED